MQAELPTATEETVKAYDLTEEEVSLLAYVVQRENQWNEYLRVEGKTEFYINKWRLLGTTVMISFVYCDLIMFDFTVDFRGNIARVTNYVKHYQEGYASSPYLFFHLIKEFKWKEEEEVRKRVALANEKANAYSKETVALLNEQSGL